ncbi:MAG: signal peptidase I [Elusimicrobiales bacterium]|nr:signal peptidase I [Elusimicrobiales bacterium]
MKTNITRIIVIVAITLSVIAITRKYIIEPIYIVSESMEPTLYKNHRLFLDKFTYKIRKPKRGEVISFKSPVKENHDSVKRVIAIKGDIIQLIDKKVYLNNEPQIEIYVKYTRAHEKLKGDNLGPLEVPAGHLFVLGDNRDNSEDSASWKNTETDEPLYFLKLSLVTGKVRGIY